MTVREKAEAESELKRIRSRLANNDGRLARMEEEALKLGTSLDELKKAIHICRRDLNRVDDELVKRTEVLAAVVPTDSVRGR